MHCFASFFVISIHLASGFVPDHKSFVASLQQSFFSLFSSAANGSENSRFPVGENEKTAS